MIQLNSLMNLAIHMFQSHTRFQAFSRRRPPVRSRTLTLRKPTVSISWLISWLYLLYNTFLRNFTTTYVAYERHIRGNLKTLAASWFI